MSGGFTIYDTSDQLGVVREILREAGDAAVLEPADAREAVREAVLRLTEAQDKPTRRRVSGRRAKLQPA